MSVKRQTPTAVLADLYERHLSAQPLEWRERRAALVQERARKLERLRRQGIVTVADLLDRLPRSSHATKQFGIDLISLLRLREGVPVLVEMLADRSVRWYCASTLSFMKPGRQVLDLFLKIGHRELTSDRPDRHWLVAVVHGIAHSHDRRAADTLVTIYERVDLPGWVRGEAADKLGYNEFVVDRRTSLFRRCCKAALRGLDDDSIDVQFGSMYLIGALCTGFPPQASRLKDFKSALPTLRSIAAKDHRLAPGYWWPLSAEAEDVIACIKAGQWPSPDAADRWQDHTERGEWNCN